MTIKITKQTVNRMAEWMEHTAGDIRENSGDGDILQGVDASRILISAKMLRSMILHIENLEKQRLHFLQNTVHSQVGAPSFEGGAAYERYCAEEDAKG